MHEVKVKNKGIRTDLILEQENPSSKKESVVQTKDGKITHTEDIRGHFTTIEFSDITNEEGRKELEKNLLRELKTLVKPQKEDTYLIVGLGNSKSTPDSLGPKTVEEVLVTRYLFLLGEVDSNYRNVSIFTPNVCGNTGIESLSLLKRVVEEVKPTKVIVIDSLKAAKTERLVKTIQLTDTGIHPGSGMMNDQGEISNKTMSTTVIAIGVPTVVDKNTLLGREEMDNFMVTPTNIDFLMEKLSKVLGRTINKMIHPAFFDK